MVSKSGRLRTLEENASKLFLIGGALYVIFLANRILTTYTGTSFSLASLFAWAAWILIPLGLLGLYPALVERRPYLSRAAAVVAVIPVISSAIVLIGEIIKAGGLLSEAPGPLGLTPFVAFITFSLAMALFGITTFLEDIHPKAVGILMVVIAFLFPLNMTVLSSLPDFIINGVELVAILAIGFILRTADVPTDGVNTPVDTTA